MFQIREMVTADYDPVMALWRVSESMRLREADSKENISQYLKRNPGLSFVGLAQQRIVGAVLAGTDGRRGYLQHLAVLKEFRGQGIGRRLIQKATDALKSAGVEKTHLFVSADNVNAQRFYQNTGWQPRDEIRMYSFNTSPNPEI